ncbi:FAD-dependent oxidoreductase [Conexibacter sp. CPCC 206217]|uniref:FAD-dependent oxidoreductase n=1 Tax=Conexibacter sp. CPCC 206217 TaxID=3064574 RepID=UPI002717AB5E|nr:FAD-dependent oxidoreductase [Conexibacter sp. CPCC 206217]MDO8211731.1 FAD-dependent oxidoreductase [Conexibacter sp. CPCC 206217]
MTATTTPVPPAACDLAIVGAGLLGLATARELLRRQPGLKVAVIEREPDVAAHQSGHNSGVIHAGIYYKPGSLKAQLCVTGASELYAFCEQHAIDHERCGKLVVATDASELPRLDELERRGVANGVPGLRRLDAAGMAEIEPHVRGVAALHSPDTGIVDFPAVARALAGEVVAAGGTVTTGCAVEQLLEPAGGGVELVHAHGRTRARRAVVCAGAWADVLVPRGASRGGAAGGSAVGGGAVGGGAVPDVRIVPFRGAYRVLREPRAELVKALIYPVPDPELPFLGIHLTRGIDREVHVGPTALMVAARDAYRLSRIVPADVAATLRWPGTYRMVRRWWRTGFDELRHAFSTEAVAKSARRFIPEIQAEDLLPGPSGVRGQAVGRDGALIDDFVVSESAAALHVRNAPSPAATASLALARSIADRVERALG